MTIWEYNRLITRRLIQWALISKVLGLLMLTKRGFWSGMGWQFIGWAAVNFGIAYFGFNAAQARLEKLGSARNLPNVRAKEARGLRRLLWINFYLDIFYMLGGLWLFKRNQSSERMRGTGLGILLQGAFLFLFDYFHAINVPDVKSK